MGPEFTREGVFALLLISFSILIIGSLYIVIQDVVDKISHKDYAMAVPYVIASIILFCALIFGAIYTIKGFHALFVVTRAMAMR